jgi:hypothetical protein
MLKCIKSLILTQSISILPTAQARIFWQWISSENPYFRPMALFQESINKKHLRLIDEHLIESAYLEYKRVYLPEKIKNIKVAKEEQYQEGVFNP